MNKLTIVKVGGKVVEDRKLLRQLIIHFCTIEGNKILVHGGGKKATEIAQKLGIETVMHDGRRITDENMLSVAVMVYAGLTNKNIVAQIQSKGFDAVGLSGADLNIIQSQKRKVVEIDFGFVGDVETVDAQKINFFISNNIIPVFCAITHDNNGQLLNTNADTIASEVAIAMSKLFDVELIYCFEKKGVLQNIDDENSVIPLLTKDFYCELKQNKFITEGMIPKLDNCFNSLDKGVKEIKICSSEALENKIIFGTKIIL